jgi:hypothetical protein
VSHRTAIRTLRSVNAREHERERYDNQSYSSTIQPHN